MYLYIIIYKKKKKKKIINILKIKYINKNENKVKYIYNQKL